MKAMKTALTILMVMSMVFGTFGLAKATSQPGGGTNCSCSRGCSCASAPDGWPCSTSCSLTGACECDSGCDSWDGAWCKCGLAGQSSRY